MPRITITAESQSPQPYRFGLDRQSVSLGRGEDCDILVDCGSVSLQHAVMERVPGGYQLRDLGSTNGIELDGVRQDVIALVNGQDVKLGDVDFDFVLSDDELGVLALEKPVTAVAQELPPLPTPQPAMAAAPQHQQSRPAQQQAPAEAGMSSGGLNSVAVLLAVIAFFIGMAIHFNQQTGESLITVINNRITGTPVEDVPPASNGGEGAIEVPALAPPAADPDGAAIMRTPPSSAVPAVDPIPVVPPSAE